MMMEVVGCCYHQVTTNHDDPDILHERKMVSSEVLPRRGESPR